MARQVRDKNLETRNARRRQKIQAEPHWRSLDKGLHIGYRKRGNGGSWIARRFTSAGKYKKAKIGLADDFQDADGITTLDYKQAQEAARLWYHKSVRIEAGLEDEHLGPYTVSHAMSDYLEHYQGSGKSYKDTEARINAFIIPKLGDYEVSLLAPKLITKWHHALASAHARLRSSKTAEKKNTRKTKGDDAVRKRRATANRVLTILKAALNHAWKEGVVSSDEGWRRVTPFKNVDSPVIRYLTEEECSRLINASQSDLRHIVRAAIYTGCRYGELTKMKVKDFNSEAGSVLVRESKSGKPRHVVLSEEGQDFFEQQSLGKKSNEPLFTRNNGDVWGKSHQSRPLKEACKNANIEPVISFHILRHTHGSFLAMRGVPMAVIAQQLGHADTRMTEKHYAHLSPSYVADTIRRNLPVLSGEQGKKVVKLKRKA